MAEEIHSVNCGGREGWGSELAASSGQRICRWGIIRMLENCTCFCIPTPCACAHLECTWSRKEPAHRQATEWYMTAFRLPCCMCMHKMTRKNGESRPSMCTCSWSPLASRLDKDRPVSVGRPKDSANVCFCLLSVHMSTRVELRTTGIRTRGGTCLHLFRTWLLYAPWSMSFEFHE